MKKTTLIIFSILIMCAMGSIVNAKTATTSPATAAAIKLYKSGNYTQSYVAFSELIKKDPSNALAYYYLGMTSVQLGKRDEAITNYNKAVELSPNGILGSYAKKGIKCTENPITCHDPALQNENETPEDRFIKGKFGSGLSDKAREVYEKQKIENIKREINRQNDLSPQRFKEYKDFSSQAPSNEEIVTALKVLNDAGLGNLIGNQNYSDISQTFGMQQYDKNDYEMLNMLLGNNHNSVNGLSPEVIQALLTTQMTTGL